jgi:hypothetical protein
MKKIMLIVLMLWASTSIAAEAGDMYAEVDREMIELLALSQDQAIAYKTVIEKQRELFLTLNAGEWQQELAFYQQTFALLKEVLTDRQYVQFVGIINSVIEDSNDDVLLVMGDP